MKASIFLLLLFIIVNADAALLSGKYELKSSKINYLVTYLIKKADADSSSAKGKGECKESCDFLVAVPIKSFESKDSNRDLNMLKVTKADKYPLAIAKIKTKKEISNNVLLADLEIDFCGTKKNYSNIAFKASPTADGFHVEGTFDLLLDQHNVEKPSLLGVDIDNIVPLRISADWKKN